MANDRVITCSNEFGYSVTFTEKGFTPFLLMSIDGIYTVENNVTISDNKMIDGSQYQGMTRNAREIVITCKDVGNHRENRDTLNSVFLANNKGTMVVQDEDVVRKIEYYVRKITSTGVHDIRAYIIELVCPDPFFYEEFAHVAQMANYQPMFEFEHEFSADGETIEERSSAKLVEINNETADDSVGIAIEIEANGAVTNPKITLVETQQYVQVGFGEHPFSLVSGEKVIITTSIGNKHIYHVSGDEKVEVNQYLDPESSFMQIRRGINTVGYSADEGADNMIVKVTYYPKFVSV